MSGNPDAAMSSRIVLLVLILLNARVCIAQKRSDVGRSPSPRSSLVWDRIVNELVRHQDKAPRGSQGQIVNPIHGYVGVQDTACAAKVFAVEYRRTGDPQWLKRAKAAMDSLDKVNLYAGVSEPVCHNGVDWREDTGSLFITGTVLDAVWRASRLLDEQAAKAEPRVTALLDYVESCKVGPGRFAHNTVLPGSKSLGVQNTIAFALYLAESSAKDFPSVRHAVLDERERALQSLIEGQDDDGFWSYYCPNWEKRSGPRNAANAGDSMHQCLVLYYFTKTVLMRSDDRGLPQVARGWNWVSRRLKWQGEKCLTFDWDWEPKPSSPGLWNYRDTNTYFLILASLPLMVRTKVLASTDAARIAAGVLGHIEVRLLKPEGTAPCIQPLEGPDEVIRKVFPMVEEGVHWKGALLAEALEITEPLQETRNP